MPVNVISKIEIKNNPTNAVVNAAQVTGGYIPFVDATARNLLDATARVEGLLARTNDDGKLWTLNAGPWNNTNTDWTEFVVGTTTPDATDSVKGILKLANDLGGTADLPEVVSLTGTLDDVLIKAISLTFDTNPLDATITRIIADEDAATSYLVVKGQDSDNTDAGVLYLSGGEVQGLTDTTGNGGNVEIFGGNAIDGNAGNVIISGGFNAVASRGSVSINGGTIDIGNDVDGGPIAIESTSTINVTSSNYIYIDGPSINITGNTYLNNDLAVTGATNLTGNLIVNGTTNLNSNLTVSGTTGLTSNLTVGGTTTLTGTATANGTLQTNGTFILNDVWEMPSTAISTTTTLTNTGVSSYHFTNITPITINLPITPTTGLTFVFKDSGGAAANNITIQSVGKTINGSSNYIVNQNYQSVTVTYIGSNKWVVTSTTSSSSSPTFTNLTVTGTITSGGNIQANGILSINDRISMPNAFISTSVTLTSTSSTAYALTNTAPITVTLPASPSSGQIFTFEDYGGGAATNNITLAAAGPFVINGAATYVINQNYQAVTIHVSGGNEWIITSNTVVSTGPTGAAGGDLSGTYPNPTVAKLLGKTLNAGIGTAGAGQDGFAITWANGASNYTLTSIANSVPDATSSVKGKLQLTNDLGGSAAAPTVVRLSGLTTIGIGATNLRFDDNISSPSISQVTQTTGVSGNDLTIQAQSTDDTQAGTLYLKSGETTSGTRGDIFVESKDIYLANNFDANNINIGSDGFLTYALGTAYLSAQTQIQIGSQTDGGPINIDSPGAISITSASSNVDIFASTINLSGNTQASNITVSGTLQANDLLVINDRVTMPTTGISTSVTLTATSSTAYALTNTAPITITLPGTPSNGQIFTFEDYGGGAATNNITLAASGPYTINGAATFVINQNYQAVTIHVAGGNEWIITSNTAASGGPTGAAGGDLSGTYPNPTVNKILNKNLSSLIGTAGAAQDGYTITWVNASNAYGLIPTAPNATDSVKGILKLTNDLAGTADLPEVFSLTGTGGGGGTVNIKADTLDFHKDANAAIRFVPQLTGIAGNTLRLTGQATDDTQGGNVIIEGGTSASAARGTVDIDGSTVNIGLTGTDTIYIGADFLTSYANLVYISAINGVNIGNASDAGPVVIDTIDSVSIFGPTVAIGDMSINTEVDVLSSTYVYIDSPTIDIGNVSGAINLLGIVESNVEFLASGKFTVGASLNILYNTITTSVTLTATGSAVYSLNHSAPITVTLPATPADGQVVILNDDGAAGTNNVTIDGNGNNINGLATATIDANYGSITLHYNIYGNWIILASSGSSTPQNIYTLTSPVSYPYTVLPADYVILVDTSSASNTLTLPASPVSGHALKVKDKSHNASNFPFTIDGNSIDIDGNPDIIINSNSAAIELVYNGTEWNIL